jgi:hypothetical protein
MQDNHPYLIIGGSTKCGTTSLFNYFEFHTGVCACSMKESRYFLEPKYKLIAAKRDHSSITEFGQLFKDCKPSQVRIEATPDYLYSAHALNRIAKELPNTKMVFILRKPIGRLMSWFRYSKQLGLIDATVGFDDFVEMQKTAYDAPQHLRSLEQGLYSNYLEKAAEILGKDKIMICFYENLERDPKELCKRICSFAGLDHAYFENFEFVVYNKSTAGRAGIAARTFRKLKRLIKPLKQRLPLVVRKRLKLASLAIESTLKGDSTSTGGSIQMQPETESFLSGYYADESDKIQRITGLIPPWNK